MTGRISGGRHHLSGKGLTLLELLVAMSLLFVLIGALMMAVDVSTKLWRENESRTESYRESRAALNMMAHDLGNALAGTNSSEFLVNESAFGRLPGEAVTNITCSGAIFFLAAFSAGAQDPAGNKGDICEVGYFLAFGKSSAVTVGSELKDDGLDSSMNLYRYFRSSNVTFTNARAGTLFTNVTLTGAETELLARNIKSIVITPYQVENGEPSAFSQSVSVLPDLVEISITALNQFAAKKFVSESDWTNTSGALTNVVNQVQQTFVTRIRLHNSAL